jgi:hypothetical protein
MKEKESIVKLVFGCIDEVVSTTENIHKRILEKKTDSSQNGFQKAGNGNMFMTPLRPSNGKVEELVRVCQITHAGADQGVSVLICRKPESVRFLNHYFNKT